ncbi:protein-S-isoprenylcysteine O-methyltransferase Ste14 [Flavimobilis soli]|uniref:Protein-S-isoprenylcysteine O-methyltransferase Ste14 n=1 Tax=Flavimobilis soli TaxID=442709 RepID=A0A2A9EDW0_9MICO|nr:isoprenylcysteine carboxylmethyltransferase family protein [Flavimobilis soli]PFG36826.1 protein-S-isoprenylcysteine O-methyltransferase Ste14 [Flavimobilis soli]
MNTTNITKDLGVTDGRVPPVVLAGAAWLAQSVVSRKRGGALARTAGAALGVASLTLAGASAADFARRRTTVDPRVPDASTLVTSGVNAVTRNPMYVGLVGVLVARAVARRSVLALAPAAAVAYLLHTRQIPAEEEALAEKFGTEYADYLTDVPRWLDSRSVEAVRTLVEERLG